MATITLRTSSPAPLTNAQVDANFSNLNTEKIERNGSIPMTGKLTLDGPIAANASVNFPTGANPTTLVAGDVWNNSNTLKMYNGTGTVTFATVSSAGVVAPSVAQINSSAFLLDASGDISIDSDTGNVILKDNGTTFGVLNNNTGNLVIKSGTENGLAFAANTHAVTNYPDAYFYGELKAPYFTTDAATSGYPAFTNDIVSGSTSIFGSWGNEPGDSNIEFRGGISHNIGLDCTGPGTASFNTKNDGLNNGGSMMLMTIGGRIEFYGVASTGNTDQTISAATMWNTHRNAYVDETGKFFVKSSLGVGIAPSVTAGRIDAINDVVAFSTSDERLKKNIENITDALEKVLSLRGVTFTWDEEHHLVHGYTGKDTGVIAQDVEKVLPEVIQHRDNGYMAVKYEKMIGLLIEAIKELNNKVDKCNCNCNK